MILTLALLVVAQTVAVPWHIASAHGHGLLHLHAHPTADDCHDHEERSAPDSPQCNDASGMGCPHHHDTHAHAVTDHGFSRPRVDRIVMAPAVIAVSCEQPLLVVAKHAIEVREFPPPKVMGHSCTSLRGPPVC